MAGIFADTEGENAVNRINAAAIAQERGIRIQEDKKEFVAGGTGSVLKLTLHTSIPGGTGAIRRRRRRCCMGARRGC